MSREDKKYSIIDQDINTYAHLPRIRHPDGGRVLVDDPDLWWASKVNATLKQGSAHTVYWEKKEQDREKQLKFIESVRNHSWNRQHMGSMVVSGVDIEFVTSSLVSSAFALGKFYKIQQQTRRSVILEEVLTTPVINDNPEVIDNFQRRFDLYWDIIERRPKKVKGFDPYVQDAFKILPLSVKTHFSGLMDMRTAKAYVRWQNMDYLPSAVQEFGARIGKSIQEEYPVMMKTFDLSELNRDDPPQYAKQQRIIELIGSNDLMEEPMLWYQDHSFLLPENRYFEKIYNDMQLEKIFTEEGPDATFMGYFNPLGLSLEDILELLKNKDEPSKSAMELGSFAFISKVDISGGIDTWRHTRNNRIVQPIYHALEHNPSLGMPILYKKQKMADSEIPDQFMALSKESLDLYNSLIKQDIPAKEAINVLPHNLELIQVEMMDIFSFLNMMAIRTCIHARPEVQQWAKALLRELGRVPDFKGIDNLSEERSNLLARAIVNGYCAETGHCKRCGKDKIYLTESFVKK